MEMDPERRVALMEEANRKIMEAELMEEKRRRKAAKISHMVGPPSHRCACDLFLSVVQVQRLDDPIR